jgi:hypothetical protein
MEKSYEENMKAHIEPLVFHWREWKGSKCDYIAYGQTMKRERIHRVWLDHGWGDARKIDFLVKDLKSAETEGDVVKLFDVAWAQLLLKG